jgi:hypothetical protein
MSAGKYPKTFPADEASSWRRIRKDAVPRWMIEQATERRLADDWQGACAAANVDVTFDLSEITTWCGPETGAMLEDDLRHFAPDMLRWHLPRYRRGRTTLSPGQRVILAGYSDRPMQGPFLYVATSKMVDGPQRLTLRFGGIDEKEYSWASGSMQDWRLARHLWDARLADELRERCGGGDRVPFRDADGTPRSLDELPKRDPGLGDPAARTEWITLLCDGGEIEQAFKTMGITLDGTLPQVRHRHFKPPALMDVLAKHPLALTMLEPEVRRLAAVGLGTSFQIRSQNRRERLEPIQLELNADTPGLTVRMDQWDRRDAVRPFPEASWRRLPDLDLLRFGDITPEQLHPLVSASLFPERVPHPEDGPRDLPTSTAIRIRCRGEWHEARPATGGLRIPHSLDEQQRERMMRTFGGAVPGCFAVQQAWKSGVGWLPKKLRDQRREFFSYVQHGDTPAVIQMLDAGTDPHIRDGRQRTLLHLLHLLDHEVMLPRLLDAGLDLEARDHHQRTPLHVAVGEGPVDLVHALLDAGARIDVVDSQDRALPSLIIFHNRPELRFLCRAVIRDYPNLTMEIGFPARDDLTPDELNGYFA